MTDAGPRPGLIIVNLKTKKSWRRFNENPLTTATAKFVPVVAGVPVQPITNGVYGHMAVGADGISLNADGTRLYWCPLSSRLLYSIDTDLLTDPDNEDTDLEQSVTKHGDQGGGVGGLEIDSKDRLYLANYEHNLISRRHPDTGRIEPLVRDPRNIWPDTMQVADGYLYWTANQIVRANPIKPFYLFRVPIDAERVRL
ncbi:hypothetical protein K7432_008690 [Basidiobolus ranarum]|uniref:Major royal jelly protein n=1 Tax=Basidiobolus ranarum TaxID=34480 RepID=A0ABR2WRF2_9FUNG